MATQMTVVRQSATTLPESRARDGNPVDSLVKLIDTSKCIGCKACQVACMEWNDLRDEIGTNDGRYENPHDLTGESWTLMRFAEYEDEDSGDIEWLIRKDGCMHCAEPGCLEACPAPGAIVQYSNGIVDFNQDKCIGCGYCIPACPFDIPRLSKKDQKSYKCTLCSDRVGAGLEPACVKACPTGAIVFGTEDDMDQHAEERIADLKSRGYDNAGLYDPDGVGGTHVKYVLHHVDQPELYNDLPAKPSISTSVKAWKGSTKPVGLLAMAGVAAAGFMHYLRVGRVQTEEADEQAARQELESTETQEEDES